MKLVNHFKLGADPEFVIVDKYGEWLYGNKFGLRTGRAWGADQNGRLVEIRAYPSRSAVEVVASIADTLRWMNDLNPKISPHQWLCGPFVNEALGGHVHIGRLNGLNREREIDALERVYEGVVSKLWRPEEVEQRHKWGYAHRQNIAGNFYGQNRDIRLQPHGYEYRVWPSWLSSPWLAHFVLTLSKLAAARAKQVVDGFTTIRGLLEGFADKDEDAQIALTALNAFGVPRDAAPGRDFRRAWGVDALGGGYAPPAKLYVPSIIKPLDRTIVDARAAIANRYSMTVPPKAAWVPNWPTQVPAGFIPVQEAVDLHRYYGLGELFGDVFMSASNPFSISGAPLENDDITLGGRLGQKLAPHILKLRTQGLRVTVAQVANTELCVSERLRKPNHYRKLRQLFTSGLFPLWTIEQAKPDSYETWLRSLEVAQPKRGRVVHDQRAGIKMAIA